MSQVKKGRNRRGDAVEGQTPKSAVSVVPLGKTKEWQEGYEASRRGTVRGRNPYGSPPTTQEGVDWQEGWISYFTGERI